MNVSLDASYAVKKTLGQKEQQKSQIVIWGVSGTVQYF